jgi:hypothetical protein
LLLAQASLTVCDQTHLNLHNSVTMQPSESVLTKLQALIFKNPKCAMHVSLLCDFCYQTRHSVVFIRACARCARLCVCVCVTEESLTGPFRFYICELRGKGRKKSHVCGRWGEIFTASVTRTRSTGRKVGHDTDQLLRMRNHVQITLVVYNKLQIQSKIPIRIL